MIALQCPEVPRRCTRCSTRRPCPICRGFPPCTTSESSTTVRRRECCKVRSRLGCSHCRTCARRIHWRPRRPRSSRWHRRGLRRGRGATIDPGVRLVRRRVNVFEYVLNVSFSLYVRLTILGMTYLVCCWFYCSGLFPECMYFQQTYISYTSLNKHIFVILSSAVGASS